VIGIFNLNKHQAKLIAKLKITSNYIIKITIFARSKKESFLEKINKKHQYEMSISEIKYNFL